jgi:hypothetical protein
MAKKPGCPTLAVYLFLRLGWDTSNVNRRPIFHEVSHG